LQDGNQSFCLGFALRQNEKKRLDEASQAATRKPTGCRRTGDENQDICCGVATGGQGKIKRFFLTASGNR